MRSYCCTAKIMSSVWRPSTNRYIVVICNCESHLCRAPQARFPPLGPWFWKREWLRNSTPSHHSCHSRTGAVKTNKPWGMPHEVQELGQPPAPIPKSSSWLVESRLSIIVTGMQRGQRKAATPL